MLFNERLDNVLKNIKEDITRKQYQELVDAIQEFSDSQCIDGYDAADDDMDFPNDEDYDLEME